MGLTYSPHTLLMHLPSHKREQKNAILLQYPVPSKCETCFERTRELYVPNVSAESVSRRRGAALNGQIIFRIPSIKGPPPPFDC